VTTYTYTGDLPRPYPDYLRRFTPEDPAEETLYGPLNAFPGHSGYDIVTKPGNEELPVPPDDGRWVPDEPDEP
jgi:hypothetical protein